MKSAEEMIGEYFGLRKEAVYSDDGTEIIDMINEFRDPIALKSKKVRFVPYFAEKGMTQEMFDKAVPPQYRTPEDKLDIKKPVTEPNGKPIDSDSTGDGNPESEPVVPTPHKGTGRRKA